MDRFLDYISGVDLLGDQDLGDGDERVEDVGVEVHAAAIEACLDYIPSSVAVEPSVYPTVFEVESSEPAEKPSVEAPPSLELKELPPHLEYAFLDGDSDLPVIISAALTDAGFYRRFIKDFSKITRPITRLHEKDVEFVFDDDCLRAFEYLKERLVSAPIMIAPDWS
ncbi:hypothetical protein E3N88_39816 [Mikania micrantha]|uniref:Reverse transcriptase/retrotransposon-derived protein RNase H-like domain-containing protein n=1 Tax=Mikania micrantha TaxID=192012 RepID=A0A5N6LKV5_9ASTR|nr:hypothetical protein E3N88_39816 [Mikania micrantha]